MFIQKKKKKIKLNDSHTTPTRRIIKTYIYKDPRYEKKKKKK